jgi:hypothetical protein
MKWLFLTGIAAAMAAVPAFAQGPIGTLERGTYVCELPGDASREAGIAQPEANFRIIGASRYSSAQGRGIYLRRGDVVTFTSGPRSGEAYAVISPAFLRRMENGKPGELRCVRKGE